MKEIVVDVGTNQTKVALLENKELVEICIERHNSEKIAGNIYKGRVENVLPGMQAAFIDIGIGKNAFLFVKDALPYAYCEEDEFTGDTPTYKEYQIDELLKVGQEIMVQVIKEPIDTKGPRVTTHITLPGRHLVLMPTVEYIGISRRIEEEAERERLRAIIDSLKPRGMGLIVRTAAEGCTAEEFESDISFLRKLWENIKNKQRSGIIPRLVHKDMNVVYRTVRDMLTKDTDKFIINSKEQYEKVLEIVDFISPTMRSKVHYFNNNSDLFDYYQIESKISKLMNRKVWLKCGGYIVIDQTEALTSIDVNTGKFVGSVDLKDTVLKTNVEAAREIAKQLRLRDIGGIIIIDFIDMPDKEHENVVIEVLKTSLKKDRTRTNVLDMTQLGLLEMTRKKVRQRIESVLLSPCPYCDGEGRILSDDMIIRNVEKEIHKIFAQNDTRAVYIEVNPDIERLMLADITGNLEKMEKMFNKKIYLKSISILHRDEYLVKATDGSIREAGM